MLPVKGLETAGQDVEEAALRVHDHEANGARTVGMSHGMSLRRANDVVTKSGLSVYTAFTGRRAVFRIMRDMAAPRSVPGLDPDEPFGAAAGRVVTVRADELWTMAEKVRRTADPEAIHDMRVASRRLRAALEVFATCFPKKRHRAVVADVKALTDALGARRDPDVLLEALAPLRERLGRQEQPGVAALTAALTDERAAGSMEVEAALGEAERTDLNGRIEELVRAVRT
jgi:hypothetical protein